MALRTKAGPVPLGCRSVALTAPSIEQDELQHDPSANGLARSGLSKLSVVPFVVFHAIPILVIFTGVTMRAVVIALVTYFVRLVAITAGYHRYFSHRTYRTGRVRQFLLALVGVTAVQRGPLWWAGNPRAHHRYSDTDRDPHSATRGFWWSHVGWILSASYANTNVGRPSTIRSKWDR